MNAEMFKYVTGFVNSVTWQNRNRFNMIDASYDNAENWITTKDPIDLLLSYVLTMYTLPTNILEIGVYEGLTAGILHDASPSSHITGIDIKDYLQKCRRLHGNFIDLKLIDSALYTDNTKYNVIHVDGNHSFDHAVSDITLAQNCLAQNGIIIIDDYNWTDVRRAADTALLSSFKPLIITNRCSYWVTPSLELGWLIDTVISNIVTSLGGDYSNISDPDGSTGIISVPLFTTDQEIFNSILHFLCDATINTVNAN